jgi:predicted acylesterase/phospholipase RssA/CRP-like cAMP-binding protein
MTDLSLTGLREVSSGSIVRVEASQEITQPGFYIVNSGHIEVRQRSGDQTFTVCRLEPNEGFVVPGPAKNTSYHAQIVANDPVVSLEQHDMAQDKEALVEAIAGTLHLRLHRFEMLLAGLKHLAEDLSPEFVENLYDASEYLILDPFQVLLREGDPADSVFFLLQGRLRVFMGEGDAVSEVGHIERGEIFGEMAVLSDEPRSASISAIRHSEVVKVSKDRFRTLLRDYPALNQFMNGLLVQRIKSQNERLRKRSKPLNRLLLAICPTTKALFDDLANDLNSGSVVITEQGVFDHFSTRDVTMTNPARLNELLDRLEQDNDKCHYVCSHERQDWLETVLPRADEIWLLLDSSKDPVHAWQSIAAFMHSPAWDTAKKVLVMFHQTTGPITGTAKWLEVFKPHQHFHIHVSKANDRARLKRYLLDQSLGLVLGGGGARGFAHIGMMKAFDAAGLKFDWFGGTSIGAVMSAWLGQGLAPAEIVTAIRKFFVDVNPLGDYTLPLVSLSRSVRLDRLLKEGIGLGDIEDMPLPFFCISSDLSVAEERVHQRGTLWKAVRASIAIPGVIAPVIHDNRFLIDGALLNNLPVDHMATFNSGPVVAIDVSDHEPLFADETHIPSVSEYVWRKIRGETPRVPTILETLSRSTTLAGSSRANANKLAADIYLKPDLTEFGSLEFKSAEAIIEAGYRAGLAALDNELRSIV